MLNKHSELSVIEVYTFGGGHPIHVSLLAYITAAYYITPDYECNWTPHYTYIDYM